MFPSLSSRLSLYLSVCQSVVHQPFSSPDSHPASQSAFLLAHTSLSVCLSEASQSASLSANQLINQSGCLPVSAHQSVCLSVFKSISQSFNRLAIQSFSPRALLQDRPLSVGRLVVCLVSRPACLFLSLLPHLHLHLHLHFTFIKFCHFTINLHINN